MTIDFNSIAIILLTTLLLGLVITNVIDRHEILNEFAILQLANPSGVIEDKIQYMIHILNVMKSAERTRLKFREVYIAKRKLKDGTMYQVKLKWDNIDRRAYADIVRVHGDDIMQMFRYGKIDEIINNMRDTGIFDE